MSNIINILEDTKNDIKDAIINRLGVINGGLITYADSIRNLEQVVVEQISPDTKFGYSTFTSIPKFDYSNLTDTTGLFKDSNLSTVSNVFNCSNAVTLGETFSQCLNLTVVNLSNLSKAKDISFMFSACEKLKSATLRNLTNIETISYLFSGCSSLTSVSLGDISNCISASGMFKDCSSLTSVSLGSMKNCQYMINMFEGCTSLTNLENINISEIGQQPYNVSMDGMFRNCTSLVDVSMDLSNCLSMWEMFEGCTSLTTIQDINLSNVINAEDAFKGCENLTTIYGLQDLKTSVEFYWSPNLSEASIFNIVNSVGDVTSISRPPYIGFHTNSVNKLTDYCIQTLAQKGWRIIEAYVGDDGYIHNVGEVIYNSTD